MLFHVLFISIWCCIFLKSLLRSHDGSGGGSGGGRDGGGGGDGGGSGGGSGRVTTVAWSQIDDCRRPGRSPRPVMEHSAPDVGIAPTTTREAETHHHTYFSALCIGPFDLTSLSGPQALSDD